jgi:hypothetical protein
MPNLLRNLRINEGSLVDEPANQKARVLLFKRAKGGDNVSDKPMKTEDGEQYPAEAYAYVPDPSEPSTWKLRLWESPEKKETAKQVGMAVAALGEGFRGNKVDIPEVDLPKVKAKVRAAWKKTHPDASDDDLPDVLKKRRLRDVIKSWFAYEGIDLRDDEDDNGAKPAHDLQTALQMDVYSDQLLAVLTAALADTIDSVIDDPNIEDKLPAIQAALQDYQQRLQAVGIAKVGRKMSGPRLDNLKQVKQLIDNLLSEVDDTSSSSDSNSEGDDQVNIDKSKLPEDVRKYVDGLEAEIAELKKHAGGQQQQPGQSPEDIWKSVPEAVRKRFEELEKRAKEAEEVAKRERDERVLREYVAKAQAFRGLPVQPDEFGKVLKSLAEKAPEEYQKVEDVLKAADEAIAKGKLFAEVGKSGGGTTGGALAQLESIAKSKMEASGGTLTKEQAFAKACEENPTLYEQYRREMN